MLSFLILRLRDSPDPRPARKKTTRQGFMCPGCFGANEVRERHFDDVGVESRRLATVALKRFHECEVNLRSLGGITVFELP